MAFSREEAHEDNSYLAIRAGVLGTSICRVTTHYIYSCIVRRYTWTIICADRWGSQITGCLLLCCCCGDYTIKTEGKMEDLMNRWTAHNLKSVRTFCGGFRSHRSRLLWEIANLCAKKKRPSNIFFRFSQDIALVRVVSFYSWAKKKGNVQVEVFIRVVSNVERILRSGLGWPELETNSLLTFTGAWVLI